MDELSDKMEGQDLQRERLSTYIQPYLRPFTFPPKLLEPIRIVFCPLDHKNPNR